ncbi:MAG TPA: carboxypeptidase regulatory-like domain-containing protein [Bryobacteraceae bacterium]
MRFRLQLGALLIAALAFTPSVMAQAPTGSIGGTVTDSSGGILPSTPVTVTSKATDAVHNTTTASDGTFNVPSLAPGLYEVRIAVQGFRTIVREATVATGSLTTVDLQLQVGATKDVVTVEAASAQIAYESHTIDGVITRTQIEELPLNGRNFLNLAALEPGVTVSAGTTSQLNALMSVSILGGGSDQTSITVDGGNIRNVIEGGTGMNFSQEVVQEFQVSSVNYDLSTGITAVGAVNAVTRQGSNDFHGAGYFYFRDHNMAAYPGLVHDPVNPNPFFARRNPGFWFGGPIKKDKLFFMFNLETINQVGAVTVEPNLPSVAALGGSFSSPYVGKQLSARFDYNLNTTNQLFARYSHDGNSGIGPSGGPEPVSDWLRNSNWSDQSLLGWTSSIKPTLVNDFRFSYQYWHNRNLFPTASDCPGNCIDLNGPSVVLGGSNLTVGNTSNATQGRDLRRYQWTDNLSWQKGSHRFRFGGEYEHSVGTGFWGYCDPGCLAVLTPEAVAANVPAAFIPIFFPKMPKTITSTADLNNLPFYVSGTVVGIGDPSQPPAYNIDKAKVADRFRYYVQDTYHVNAKLTVNYGIGWSWESNLSNRDLSKPAYLAPLYNGNLSPTANNNNNYSPSVGFAYSPFKDKKTVFRGGFGVYYNTVDLWQRLQERAYIGPEGNGRIQYPVTGFTNIFPGIINVSTQKPIPVGAPLQSGLLTLTLGQWNQIYQSEIGAITASLAPKNLNDLSVRNIDISKSAAELYPSKFPVAQSLQFSFGLQHEFTKDLVVNADFVRRVFNHTQLGEFDMNRTDRYINGVVSPVIPTCTTAQAAIVGYECSTGPITIWEPAGRSVYNALLVKVNKRLSRRFQFVASYALQDAHGYNGVYDMDHWNAAWGPQMARQNLTISGVVTLPWGIDFSLISSNGSKGPYQLTVNNVNLNGAGTSNDDVTSLIPGLSNNCINRGCSNSQITQAINNWNSTLAGKLDARGSTIPTLTTLSNYSFGRPYDSQDIRLTKKFTFHERYRLSLFGEMFNVLNYANLGGYGTDPSQPASFGVPTSRAGQVFGSGGPRAVQVGGRISF